MRHPRHPKGIQKASIHEKKNFCENSKLNKKKQMEVKRELCLICCDRQANYEVLPCKHCVICDTCYSQSSYKKCLQCVQPIKSIRPKCFYSASATMCSRCKKEPPAILVPCRHEKYCITCIFDFFKKGDETYPTWGDETCPTCNKDVYAIFTQDMQYFNIK